MLVAVMIGGQLCLICRNMNITAGGINPPGWRTYLAGAVFSVPAIVFWGVALVMIVPEVKEIMASAGVDGSELGWLWLNPLFLVDYGRFIVLLLSIVFLALELFSRKWPRYRRAAVSSLAWLLNVSVLYGLTLLLFCAARVRPH